MKIRSACSRASSRSSSGRACTRAPRTRCTSFRKSSTTPSDEALGGIRETHRRHVHADGSVSVDDDGRGIPVRPASGRRRAGRRDRLHPPARGRQVRQGTGAAPTASPAACTASASRSPTRSRAPRGATSGATASCTDRLRRRRRGRAADTCVGKGERHRARACASGPTRNTSIPPQLPRAELAHLLRTKAVLLPGVTVTLTIEATGTSGPAAQTWHYRAAFATT